MRSSEKNHHLSIDSATKNTLRYMGTYIGILMGILWIPWMITTGIPWITSSIVSLFYYASETCLKPCFPLVILVLVSCVIVIIMDDFLLKN